MRGRPLSEAAPASFRVLVVCVGNVCRSPLAERLLRQRLERAGAAGVVVESAGTRGLAGSPMDADARAALEALGAEGSGFSARRLDASLVQEADLVLTATKEVRAAALSLAPGAMRRTFTLREFAALVEGREAGSKVDLVRAAARDRGRLGGSDLDLPDPIGRSVQVHREVAALIEAAVGPIAAALAASG